MSITVRYFASLKENLGRGEDEIDYAEGLTVKIAWDTLHQGRPLPSNVLAAVNMEYARLDTAVKDGDELAFFPPVTGG